jgi:hypothetical protein
VAAINSRRVPTSFNIIIAVFLNKLQPMLRRNILYPIIAKRVIKVKVKVFHYKPDVAVGVPGG